MILILSKRGSESSTQDIMDWLDHLGARYVRLNGSDLMSSLQLSNHGDFKLGFDMKDINVVWFRRWMDEEYINSHLSGIAASPENLIAYHSHLKGEFRAISNRFFDQLKDKFWLSRPEDASINKLNVLKHAHEVGIAVPKTLVTTQKSELEAFLNENINVITKPLSEVGFFMDEDSYFTTKTSKVTEETLEQFPDVFFPSLFQEMIPKSYEIRTFFLEGNFYSMAIFSQLDEQTEVDFRHYNEQKPNRRVPYTLDENTIKKLKLLMERIGLITGSIDLIRSQNGEYVFLEVNPIGQFGMTSYPCNYRIEKRVAQYLIDKDEKQ